MFVFFSFKVLLNLEDSTLQFLNNAMYDAHLFVEVSEKEYLLIFQKFGVYVDAYGKRSRSNELMFPATPTAFAFAAPYLSIYTPSHVDVFNVSTAEWVQTLNIRFVIFKILRCFDINILKMYFDAQAKPLTRDGSLTMCHVSELPYIVVFSDVLGG